jgi:PhzF family phenazine biosynthesis protein
MRRFRYVVVDVFTDTPLEGNQLAVFTDARDLTDGDMQALAREMNFSESTFVLPPTVEHADVRIRICTPGNELPFAGHPTLGTCHAWLSNGGEPAHGDLIVQECNAGLIPIRRTDDGLAFAAPPLLRSGPVEDALVNEIATVLKIERSAIVDAQWADNGPGWVAVLLESADAVLALEPSYTELDIGAVGPHPDGSAEAFEVRAFFPKQGAIVEDPVTGSLNASLAEWLLRTGRATAPYVASQGTVLGRSGRVHISQDSDGTIWVGGGTVTCIWGQVEV